MLDELYLMKQGSLVVDRVEKRNQCTITEKIHPQFWSFDISKGQSWFYVKLNFEFRERDWSVAFAVKATECPASYFGHSRIGEIATQDFKKLTRNNQVAVKLAREINSSRSVYKDFSTFEQALEKSCRLLEILMQDELIKSGRVPG